MRDALLKLETITPSLKQQYDKEIQAMLEKKLTRFGRAIWLAAAIAGVGFAVWFSTLAVTMPPRFPLWGRLGFAGGALFGILWAALGARVLRRGSLDLKIDTAAVAGLSWGLPLLLVTIAMVSAPDSLVGLRMIISGLAFLIIGAVFLIASVVQQAELRTREKVLQIEYRVAELADVLKSSGVLPPPV
jgi:hypothetical protein